MSGVPLSPPAPVYLVHGEEAMLRAEAVAEIRKAVLDEAMADFNLERFDGGQCGGADVVAAAQMLPVMAERRLVVVRFVERMKADGLAHLAAYLSDPSPTTCLVLEGEKPDLRRAPFNAIKKVGHVVPCKPLYERDALTWLTARARGLGLQLEPRAAHFLAEYCGTHLATLAAELDKAAAWAGEGGRIGLEAVEETVGRGRVHTVFELADALGERRTGRAMAALGTLLDSGEAPLKVQAMIIRQFRLIARAREVLAAGGGNLAREVGVPPFVANKLAAQARGFSDREVRGAFARFARVDRDLKGGALSPRTVLEREVMGLCGSGRASARPVTV